MCRLVESVAKHILSIDNDKNYSSQFKTILEEKGVNKTTIELLSDYLKTSTSRDKKERNKLAHGWGPRENPKNFTKDSIDTATKVMEAISNQVILTLINNSAKNPQNENTKQGDKTQNLQST